jgi:hypothetical protein
VKITALALLLTVCSYATGGDVVWEPPVIIDPPNPQAGDIVRVGLYEMFYPPCLGIPQENSIGETHSVRTEANTITIDVLATTGPICNPIPISPAPRKYYVLGPFPEGEYQLNTNFIEVSGFPPDLIPPFPLPDFFVPHPYGPTISFIVRGQPEPVPALSLPAVLFLLGGVFLYSLIALRR